MRKLSPAYVVTSVVIAVAGTAFAQTTARAAAAPASTVSGGTGTTTRAVTAGVPQANVNQSNASTNTNTTTTTSTNTTTPSTGLNGSRSDNNTDGSAANTPIGSTSANGTHGAGANSASAPNDTAVTIPGTVLAPGATGYFNPALVNGTLGGITSDGERVIDNPGNASAPANAQLQFNGTIAAAVAGDSARSSQSLDRAIKQVERDRKKIGRNGQLLQSIAPRTNVDRTHEMPDDAPSPALTGSSSALTRR